MTNQGKNEDEGEKNWENEFGLWILHIKIRLKGNFPENLRKNWNEKKLLTISLFNFHYLSDKDGKKVDAKNEDEAEKNWKNEFDFWICAYQNWIIWQFLRHFWLIEAKMKM